MLKIEELDVQVVRKKMKSLRITVYPPDGRVRISVPDFIPDKHIRDTLNERIGWIRRQQAAIARRPRTPVLSFVSGETHYFKGEPLLLNLISREGRPKLRMDRSGILDLIIPAGSDEEKRKQAVWRWYRRELQAAIPALIKKRESVMGVQVAAWGVRRMRTKWGTCNIRDHRIWLNLELIKYPPHCLEYVVVHEMVHLLERLHNARFKAFMDQFLPNWREIRKELNRFEMC